MTDWVQGCLLLAGCGGAHEIDRNADLCRQADTIADVDATPDGVIITLDDGTRYAVRVTRID